MLTHAGLLLLLIIFRWMHTPPPTNNGVRPQGTTTSGVVPMPNPWLATPSPVSQACFNYPPPNHHQYTPGPSPPYTPGIQQSYNHQSSFFSSPIQNPAPTPAPTPAPNVHQPQYITPNIQNSVANYLPLVNNPIPGIFTAPPPATSQTPAPPTLVTQSQAPPPQSAFMPIVTYPTTGSTTTAAPQPSQPNSNITQSVSAQQHPPLHTPLRK